MTNEETAMKQEVIDRILRSGNVPPGYDGDIDALLSRAYDAGRAAGRGDEIARAAVATNIAMTECGNELRAALGVTAPWDGCIATVRDLVAKDKAKPAPTDAAAESAAVDGLVNEAIRQKGDHIDGHDRTGRWCLSLGDTRFDTRHEVARGWLRPWLLAAWARGVAYGQVDISTGESRCAAQLANALGHVGETLPTWQEALAMVTRDRQPTPGDFFGMAAREQVAAERAVDAAAVALSDEDSIRATFVKSEIEGLRNQAEDLDNEVKNLRRSRDSAIAAARAEGAVEAFRKVAEWCQTAVPDGIDLDAGIVEEVAKDAIGTLQHAAGAGDEKMREEGRRLGWKEAVAAANRARIVELRAAAKADGEVSRLRSEVNAAEEAHGRLVLRYEVAVALLDAMTAAAPMEVE